MSRLDELFARFVADYRARGWADPRPLLATVDDRVDRAELEARIDAFLERNPARRFVGEADLEAALADPLVQSVLGQVAAAGEDLVALRHEAQITREELTRRLADELGVSGRTDKVHDYYHRLERGQLDVGRVRPAVFDGLARLLGRSAEYLREVAQRAAESAGGAQGAAVFARSAPAPAPAAAPAQVPEDRPASERDEVDELFGG